MSYAGERLIHDADSHAFEPPGWIDAYLPAGAKERVDAVLGPGGDPAKLARFAESITAKQRDEEFRSHDAEEILLRKGFEAPGAFLADDRPAALDLLGFKSQLVFTTAYLGPLL